MAKVKGFYRKRDRRGELKTHPITERTGRRSEHEMKVYEIEGGKVIGVMARRAIRKGEGEADILPEVQHELDAGWLAFMERIHYKELDEEERHKVAELVNKAHSDDPATRAVAMTELEHRYPDAYEHAFGVRADIPREEG